MRKQLFERIDGLEEEFYDMYHLKIGRSPVGPSPQNVLQLNNLLMFSFQVMGEP